MAEPDLDAPLSRTAASAAVADIGWRYLVGELAVSVPVRSLAEASDVGAAAVAAGGADADGHLRVDLRPDRVELSVQDRSTGGVTKRDAALAQRIAGAVAAASPRRAQAFLLAMVVTEMPAFQPFWKAVLGSVDDAGGVGPSCAIV